MKLKEKKIKKIKSMPPSWVDSREKMGRNFTFVERDGDDLLHAKVICDSDAIETIVLM